MSQTFTGKRRTRRPYPTLDQQSEAALARAYWSLPENRAEGIRIGMITETTTPSSLDPVELDPVEPPASVLFLDVQAPPRLEKRFDVVPELTPAERDKLLEMSARLTLRSGPLYDAAGVYVTHTDFVLPVIRRLLDGTKL